MSGRILFVFDASSGATSALESQFEVVSGKASEIAGLFLEDINLFALASLPCSVEIRFPAGAAFQPDVSRLERELRVLARQTREAIVRLANREGVPWSFEVVRGDVVSEVIAASEDVDQVLLMSGSLARRKDAIARIDEAAFRKLMSPYKSNRPIR